MITKKIRVYGIVQGVGFRPTVSRHAAAAGITGSVCNKGPYVEIFAQGEEKCVKDFLEKLENQRRMQERNVRSERPALSAPIYQLHLLRSQTYDPGCASI